jgi:hypothetical protein
VYDLTAAVNPRIHRPGYVAAQHCGVPLTRQTRLKLRASTQRLPSFSLLQWPFFCGEDPYLSAQKGHVRTQGAEEKKKNGGTYLPTFFEIF